MDPGMSVMTRLSELDDPAIRNQVSRLTTPKVEMVMVGV